MVIDFETLKENLKARGYQVSVFSTGMEAAEYLDSKIDQMSVGIGGTLSVKAINVYDKLASHNNVYWHWIGEEEIKTAMEKASRADVYLTSANGIAETGEIINIDGTGNRVASTLYGHQKVYFIIGRNKLAPTYDDALWRARNVAAPKNAQRRNCKTPCAVKGDRCYDCKSKERICRGLVVLWCPPIDTEMEVIMVDEDLGY